MKYQIGDKIKCTVYNPENDDIGEVFRIEKNNIWCTWSKSKCESYFPQDSRFFSKIDIKEPHKHALLIKAWADGAEIQFKTDADNWITTANPAWSPDTEYRIKEDPVTKNIFVAIMRDPTGKCDAIVVRREDALATESQRNFVRWAFQGKSEEFVVNA